MNILKRIISLGLSLLILALLITGCRDPYDISSVLSNLETELEILPAYVKYSTLYIGDKQVEFDNFFPGKRGEFIVVIENEVWVVYSDMNCWKIATVDLNTLNTKEHYSGEFNSVFAWWRPSLEYEYYHNKHAYYKDGCIVLNDNEKVIEYNIEKEEYVEYANEEYLHYKIDIAAKINGEDINNPQIVFTKENTNNYFAFFEKIEEQEAIYSISKLRGKRTFGGELCLKSLFSNVQKSGNNIYITCEILDYWGHAYAVVFLYEFTSNSCKYVFSTFMSDSISTLDLYFVEVV